MGLSTQIQINLEILNKLYLLSILFCQQPETINQPLNQMECIYIYLTFSNTVYHHYYHQFYFNTPIA